MDSSVAGCSVSRDFRHYGSLFDRMGFNIPYWYSFNGLSTFILISGSGLDLGKDLDDYFMAYENSDIIPILHLIGC